MKSSSSSEELLRPLNDAVEGLQDKFMDACLLYTSDAADE